MDKAQRSITEHRANLFPRGKVDSAGLGNAIFSDDDSPTSVPHSTIHSSIIKHQKRKVDLTDLANTEFSDSAAPTTPQVAIHSSTPISQKKSKSSRSPQSEHIKVDVDLDLENDSIHSSVHNPLSTFDVSPYKVPPPRVLDESIYSSNRKVSRLFDSEWTEDNNDPWNNTLKTNGLSQDDLLVSPKKPFLRQQHKHKSHAQDIIVIDDGDGKDCYHLILLICLFFFIKFLYYFYSLQI
jgi:hypothetical protein